MNILKITKQRVTALILVSIPFAVVPSPESVPVAQKISARTQDQGTQDADFSEDVRLMEQCLQMMARLQRCEILLKGQKQKEQQRLANIPWMMEACPICFDARASKKGRLIDLTKEEHREYITALPCGHVFHTHCIKHASLSSRECTVCHIQYEATDL